MTDPKITLAHRLELEATMRQVHREEAARLVRLRAREEIGREVIKAQAAITGAEDAVLRNLPTPRPEAVKELVAEHPVVTGKRQQLERFEQTFAPAQLNCAENLATAMTAELDDAAPAPSPKPGRRPKQSGTDGGTP